MGFLEGIVDWLVSWSDSPYAPLALFVVSFLDSAAVFLPPEPLLIAMSIARPNLAILYAAIATVSSVLGAAITYYVGRLGGRPLAERFVKLERIETAEDFFQDHGTITTGVAAFTPVPYPVFALAAGISHLGIWRFVLASLTGRGARFFGMGLAVYFFGPAIQQFLKQYLGWATVIVGILIVGVYIASHYFNSRFEKRAREKEN
jgi:membrane protein YqaA with SNARE-associated domain